MDHGIDGKILFGDDPKASQAEQIMIQVKNSWAGVVRLSRTDAVERRPVEPQRRDSRGGKAATKPREAF